ncbi:MFS transporter [Corticimicrobacter populi]|uniref:MFS transporter n=2 Tax=Corticimicrobacter populi TaxID=2175229 RepID=A0A2V1K0Y6_9BURK|nr:MFS transporter [Corticimicrobacter populi]
MSNVEVVPVARQPVAGPRLWLALLALAAGGFGIGTGEFAIMGILPEVAAHHMMTEPQAGRLISAYALGVVVGAPVLAVWGARLPRIRLAISLMAAYAVTNFASALAPDFATLMFFRFLSGLPHGAYFGVAALIAASMVEPYRRGFAVGRVMMGLTVAALLGNPLAIWLGQVAGWRYPFALVGGIAVLTMVLIWRCVPRKLPEPKSSAAQELGALRNPRVWMALAIGAIGCGGMFAVMSYVAPIITQAAHLSERFVPVALSVFGAGMIAGSYAGGLAADRSVMKGMLGVLVWTMVVLLLFPVLMVHPVAVFAGVFLVGTAVALGTLLQVRLMDVAAEAQTLAASLNHSAFNLANALGAWLGGAVIEAGWGLRATGWAGAVLSAAGLVVLWLAWRQERRWRSLHRA